jgi:hypothetical protein
MRTIIVTLIAALLTLAGAEAQTLTTFTITGGATVSINFTADATTSVNSAIASEAIPGGITNLTASINNSVTSFAIDSVTPLAVNNGILIDTEVMLVTAISGTTLTVVRGTAGTTAAAHTSPDQVTMLQSGDIGTWTKNKLALQVQQTMMTFPAATIGGAKATINSSLAGAIY